MNNLTDPRLSVCPELLTYVYKLGIFRHALSFDDAIEPGEAAPVKKTPPSNGYWRCRTEGIRQAKDSERTTKWRKTSFGNQHHLNALISASICA
jgi:hypothetical protein